MVIETSARVSPGDRVIHFGSLDSRASSKVDSGNHSQPTAEPVMVSATNKSRSLSMRRTILNTCSRLHREIYLRLKYPSTTALHSWHEPKLGLSGPLHPTGIGRRRPTSEAECRFRAENNSALSERG